MHKKILAFLTAFFVFGGHSHAIEKSEIEQLNFVTTNDYPFQTPDGKGIVIEIFSHLLPDDDVLSQLNFMPWKRAFNDTKNQKRNNVLFTIKYTDERSPYFEWCCYLFEAPENMMLSMKKENLKTDDLNTLRGKAIAYWNGDSSQGVVDDLSKKGISLDEMNVSGVVNSIKMLKAGRIDLVITRYPLLLQTCADHNIDCSGIERTYAGRLEERSKNYIALSKNMSSDLKTEFVKRFKNFRASETYRQILTKYGFEFRLDQVDQ